MTIYADTIKDGVKCKGCGHNIFQNIEKIFKNGTVHIEVSCLECGKFLKYAPKDLSKLELGEFKMPMGKHIGKTLDEIYEEAPDYLEWAVKNLTGNIQRRIEEFLK